MGVNWRTLWIAPDFFVPVARIGPSDLRPPLWELVTINIICHFVCILTGFFFFPVEDFYMITKCSLKRFQ